MNRLLWYGLSVELSTYSTHSVHATACTAPSPLLLVRMTEAGSSLPLGCGHTPSSADTPATRCAQLLPHHPHLTVTLHVPCPSKCPTSLLTYLRSQRVVPGSLTKETSPGGSRMNIHGHCVWKVSGGSQHTHRQARHPS